MLNLTDHILIEQVHVKKVTTVKIIREYDGIKVLRKHNLESLKINEVKN